MGVFGQLDARQVPDNPFLVGEGTYSGVIGKSFFSFNEKKDKHQLVIEYQILGAVDVENQKYKGKNVRDWFDIFPDLTEAEYAELSSEEQGVVDRAMSALKRRLCGFKQGKQEFPGLGVDVDDLDESWDPKSLVSTEVEFAVVSSGDQGEYSNIRWVNAV